jgi:hypothetical protein
MDPVTETAEVTCLICLHCQSTCRANQLWYPPRDPRSSRSHITPSYRRAGSPCAALGAAARNRKRRPRRPREVSPGSWAPRYAHRLDRRPSERRRSPGKQRGDRGAQRMGWDLIQLPRTNVSATSLTDSRRGKSPPPSDAVRRLRWRRVECSCWAMSSDACRPEHVSFSGTSIYAAVLLLTARSPSLPLSRDGPPREILSCSSPANSFTNSVRSLVATHSLPRNSGTSHGTYGARGWARGGI